MSLDASHRRVITLVCVGGSDSDGLKSIVDADQERRSSATVSPERHEAKLDRRPSCRIEGDIGPIDGRRLQLGARIGDRALGHIVKAFETGWRWVRSVLFRLATALCPLMEREQRNNPCDLVAAAMRGNAASIFMRLAMGDDSMLCQSSMRSSRRRNPRRPHRDRRRVDAPDTWGRCWDQKDSKS